MASCQKRRKHMRNATWENIGTSVRGEKKIEDVLTAAGLNYTVEKRPVYRYERNPRKLVRISNRFTCERREDGHSYDEIVSGKYTIVQNREAFDFVNYMSDEVEFLKAGETANGLVYIIGRLPDVNILGDPFTPHVIFSNSFTGKTSIRAAICPLRIICQNQFAAAFRDTHNAVSVGHTASAERKLKEARSVLRASADYMEDLNRMAEGYAAMKVSSRQVAMVLDAMFPVPADAPQKRAAEIAAKKAKFEAQFRKAMDSPDNYVFRGTAWQLVNAYTDVLTHAPLSGKSTFDSQFVKVTFGNDTSKFLKIVDAVAV